MFRLRRYRVFLIVAVFAILVIYHFTTVQEWEEAKDAGLQRLKDFGGKASSLPSTSKQAEVALPEITPEATPVKDASPNAAVNADVSTSSAPSVPAVKSSKPWSELAHPSSGPEPEEKYEKFGMGGKGRYEAYPDLANKPVIHWESLPDNFPVPDDMLIHLPSEKPRSIPKIQHSFKSESSSAKADREKKADRIREAIKHTWDGYRSQAWLHDEVSPVSGRNRDPFNGWAATLVDGLDTLYIAGLEKEFEDAVEGVGSIDFTTSARKDIPLFETNIRYLGGLISAYDVSGQKHKILLLKAVELANVLMGAFDTPNRMPITYYYWRPTFAKNPHRAGTRVVMSEIATLSLEFTRLAQITGNNRYYDAVARITDEFEQWQNETKIPGLWPLTVDASGCSKPPPPDYEPLPGLDAQSPLQDESTLASLAKVEKSAKQKEAERVRLALEESSTGIDTRPDWEKKKDAQRNDRTLRKRQIENSVLNSESKGSGEPLGTSPSPEKVDCVPQGLTSPPNSDMESFSFGGQGDSAYEYLPKMHLLLGGTVPKYKEMYEKVIEAANKYLVFRPMVPQNLDLRIVGSVNAYVDQNGKMTTTHRSEFTHLACFAGGMWGIGGKMFNRDADLVDAAKLTNACYWGYQQSATGIMPDTADVIPCADIKDCKWNKELWYKELDPWREYREAGERLHQDTAQAAESQEIQAGAALAAAAEDAKKNPSNMPVDGTPVGPSKEPEKYLKADIAPKPDEAPKSKEDPNKSKEDLNKSKDDLIKSKDDPNKSKEDPKPDTPSIGKRQIGPADGPQAGQGSSFANDASAETKPSPSHEEYVEGRIRDEHIPEGIPTAANRMYILRPEAIESVFIMYRITGDETWREKGWKMWEAIDHWCRAEYGYSAISDTTDPNAYQVDAQESFWLAETLKYFYLLFSPPDTISLDDYVLNTEAHPFKRPK